ncbi:MAG: lysylphosphatidylglycerol synthase transmembrane domain-containing protein [Polyangiaceae bacterium]
MTSAPADGSKAPRVPLRRILAVMLLGVLVYAGFVVFRGLGSVRALLRTYDWSTFAAACALAFGNYVVRYFKWEFYLARLGLQRAPGASARSISPTDSFLTFLSGFVLTVSPGKVGEVFKSLVLFETHGVAIARTAPIVVAERVTDLIGIIALIVVGSSGFAGGRVWAGIGAALVLSLVVVVASRRLSLGIIGIVERMPGPLGRIGPKLHDAYESLAVLVAPRNLVVPTLLSIGAWFLECLSLYVILRGFGESVSVALSTFFYATSTLAGALVAITPGGLGVTEGALQSQLIELGHVSEPSATASMVLVRLATLWFAVLVGFIALSLLKRRYPKLLRD